MKKIQVLAKLLKLADTATEDDILLKTQELADENIELTASNTSLTVKVKALEKENGTLKEDAVAGKKNMAIALVDAAVAANKILPAEKDSYLELAEGNYETTKKLLDAKQAFKGITKSIEAGGEDLIFADTTKGWDWNKFFKEGKTAELQDKDPERYKTLYKAKFKTEPK
jgi:hypothetical protein